MLNKLDILYKVGLCNLNDLAQKPLNRVTWKQNPLSTSHSALSHSTFLTVLEIVVHKQSAKANWSLGQPLIIIAIYTILYHYFVPTVCTVPNTKANSTP